MRKLINKKGFSLVELMIVVVIMGILIAVAIPLYGGIQQMTKEKTCGTNQKTIRAMFAQYVLEGANSTETLFKTPGKTQYNSATDGDPKDVFDQNFLDKFDGGTLPECPIPEHHLVITAVEENQISVTCE